MQVQATEDIKMAEMKEEMEKVEEEKVEKEEKEKVEIAAWRNSFFWLRVLGKLFHNGYRGDRLQNFTTNSFKVYH